MQRLLVRFNRQGDLKYLSHLEMSRAMARAVKRAGWPLAFSQGFHPHPRLSFWHALPVGVAAQEELAEVWLNEPVDLLGAATGLQAASPDGMRILELVPVEESAPRLTRRYSHAVYLLKASCLEPPGTSAAAEALRKGLSPEDGEVMKVVGGSGGIEVALLASHREAGPRLRNLVGKVAEALGAGCTSTTIERRGLYGSRESAMAAEGLTDI